MRWVDTTTDEEAADLYRQTWEPTIRLEDGHPVSRSEGLEEDGVFWAERLKQVKTDPVHRFDVAYRALPLPAAWRECLISLRQQIRPKRKTGEPYEFELARIHELAAMASFEMSYDDLALLPFARLAALELPYRDVGCDELASLNVTDRKWMRELWGEPSQHTTASKLYSTLHAAETERVRRMHEQRRYERSARFKREIEELFAEEERAADAAPSSPSPPPSPTIPPPAPAAKPKRSILRMLFG